MKNIKLLLILTALAWSVPVLAMGEKLTPQKLDQLTSRTISCEYEKWGQWIPADFHWSPAQVDTNQKPYYDLLSDLDQFLFIFGTPKVSVDTVVDFSGSSLHIVDHEGYFTDELEFNFKSGSGHAHHYGQYADTPIHNHHFDDVRELRNCSLIGS